MRVRVEGAIEVHQRGWAAQGRAQRHLVQLHSCHVIQQTALLNKHEWVRRLGALLSFCSECRGFCRSLWILDNDSEDILLHKGASDISQSSKGHEEGSAGRARTGKGFEFSGCEMTRTVLPHRLVQLRHSSYHAVCCCALQIT